ncbi:YesL family protein [Parablautia muri]|uniref:DUF624 domain-containing protein n=1 Tax=Parablautia muri TaxID=2320879 RepID=A0A9X5BDS7_9FIRM|nr:DUF624 domain-containing protein [Parablautia muri]NBJ91880.1 DUF624 domain-containing protein [Parablautia muri]
MGRFFNMDSPLFSFLNKVADLIILNLLTLICCIPIFTVGAAMTGLNYVCLKMVRNEEGYIARGFFKSFKQNFKQATIIWLIILLVVGVLAGDVFIMRYSNVAFPTWIKMALLAVGLIVIVALMHVFPVLARFDNTIKNTFRNSLYMGILTLPKTILMIVFWILPIVIMMLSFQAFPFVFLLGISGPAFLCALLYNKTFKRFEPEQEEVVGDYEWTVAVDEEGEKEKGTKDVIETEVQEHTEEI